MNHKNRHKVGQHEYDNEHFEPFLHIHIYLAVRATHTREWGIQSGEVGADDAD